MKVVEFKPYLHGPFTHVNAGEIVQAINTNDDILHQEIERAKDAEAGISGALFVNPKTINELRAYVGPDLFASTVQIGTKFYAAAYAPYNRTSPDNATVPGLPENTKIYAVDAIQRRYRLIDIIGLLSLLLATYSPDDI